MKKYVPVPMTDIVSISKVVRVEIDDNDDQPEEEGGLDAGTYSQDSLGRVWQLKADVTELFTMFDMADPVRIREREEARARAKAAKKPRKREKA